jgi:chromosome partitioning protein
MKTIAIAGKGGGGKSTTTTNIAVVAYRAGLKVGLLDTDPQGSTRDWRRARGTSDIPVQSSDDTRLKEALAGAERAALDGVFIDMAPAIDAHALSIIGAADFVILPMRPTILDLGVTRKWIELLRSAAKPFGVVINGASPRRQGEDAPMVRDARSALRRIGAPLWSGQITNRVSIACSAIGGRGVAETDPIGPAAAEYAALWRGINRILDTDRSINNVYATQHAV